MRLPRLLIAAVVWAALCPSPAPAAERLEVPVGDAPTRGPADAPVTVVEFVDFQ